MGRSRSPMPCRASSAAGSGSGPPTSSCRRRAPALLEPVIEADLLTSQGRGLRGAPFRSRLAPAHRPRRVAAGDARACVIHPLQAPPQGPGRTLCPRRPPARAAAVQRVTRGRRTAGSSGGRAEGVEHGPPPATATSTSWERTSPGSASRPRSWTRYSSSSPRCSSATGCRCSTTPAASGSGWSRSRASPRTGTASRTDARRGRPSRIAGRLPMPRAVPAHRPPVGERALRLQSG